MNDIEKAINWTRGDRDNYDTRDHAYYYLDMAAKALEKQLTNGWIPISERLPNIEECQLNSGWFLVTSKAEKVGEAHYNGQKWVRNNSGPGYLKCENDTIYEVVAWHPLPEPWRDDTNEN